MNWRGFFKAFIACFQGNRAVENDFKLPSLRGNPPIVPEIKSEPENELERLRAIKSLRSERQSLSILRASLRRRKKRHTHLDPRLVEIGEELRKLERRV